MFKTHKIIKENGKDILYLYLDKNDTEFSSDFQSRYKISKQKIEERVKNFIQNNQINFKGKVVKIFVGSMLVSTLILGSSMKTTKIDSESNTYNVEKGEPLSGIADEHQISILDLKYYNALQNDVVYPNDLLKVKEIKTSEANQINDQNTTNNKTEKDSVITDPQDIPELDKIIKLKQTNGVIIELSLEDYVVGVVSSEMDPSFNEEALKAQALAARTYAMQIQESNKTLLSTDYHQVYRNETELRKLWGEYFDSFNQKVRKAVSETSGEVIKYQGDYIEAFYFSTSNGKTENPSYIWGGEVEYLKSVDSSYDIDSREFYSTKTMTLSEFTNSLNLRDSNPSINVISYTPGERIDLIEIGGETFSGDSVRSKLNLRSTDFSIEINNNIVTIGQQGFGHGVGMSQYGAHFMGRDGYSYQDIIHHYYYGVDIVKI